MMRSWISIALLRSLRITESILVAVRVFASCAQMKVIGEQGAANRGEQAPGVRLWPSILGQRTSTERSAQRQRALNNCVAQRG